MAVFQKVSWGINPPPGPLGTIVAVLFMITIFVSGWSCALAPLLSGIALFLFVRDPERSQSAPGERSRLLAWIVGSGVAWCAALACFAHKSTTETLR